MGQKIPPRANRLGITEVADSTTFAEFRSGEFAAILQEDMAVRTYVKKKLKNAGVSKILIQRKPGQIQVGIVTARPGLVFGKASEGLDIIKAELAALVNRPDLNMIVNVFEVNKVDLDARLIAEGIAQQLERRIAFRRAMKQSIQRGMRAGAKGIKIMCSGRLSGIEIARSENTQEGSVPCHTWRADIDYGFAEAQTTYGIIGIKVWLNKGILEPGEKSRPNIKAAAGHSAKEENKSLAA
ncbi:MAG: 30S ribosomal protein S3 [Candidatus Melainabacteria bacterium]|jgi:small subunit ribosomal protein S3|nr:30S ribosomal protein S3 [Candidatus Melainabacteria bacterium]